MSVHFTQLFALLYRSGKHEQLASAIDQAKSKMKSAGEAELWHYWRALALAANGSFSEALDEANFLKSEIRFDATRGIASERARQTQDYQPLLEILTERWEVSRSAADLMALCETQLHAGNIRFVAEHAHELVASASTTGALRVALSAAYRMENWKLCLELLNGNAHLFQESRLPSDLRRLQVSCSQALGLLDEARREAESLAREDESAENLSLLLHVHVQSGNLKQARFPAHQLVQSKVISAEQLVEIARVMRLEDPELASTALRKAVERDLHGAQPVGVAASIALQLNEESLLPILLQKVKEEATKGSPYIVAASPDQFLEENRAAAENARRGFAEWRAGRVPVHFLRALLNVPLAGWPVFALANASQDGLFSSNPPVFFRYGGRPAHPPARSIRRLYVDLTALHLAFELKLLKYVEDCFGPLFVAPAARSSLVSQADFAMRDQPNIVSARQLVVRLLNEGKITIWTPTRRGGIPDDPAGIDAEWWQAVYEMKDRNGLVVDYWPKLTSQGTLFTPTEEIASSVTSMSRVLDALEVSGFLERLVVENARMYTNPASEQKLELPTPRPDQTLFLDGNVADALAQAGLLEAASRVFRLLVSESDAQLYRAETLRHDLWQRLGRHLRDLRDHLTDHPGYNTLTLEGTSKSELPLDDPSEVALTQLLQAEAGEGHYAWIDDRLLNSFTSCGPVPVISTLGILEELRRNSRITPTEFFGFRHRLRAGDFRYIPLTAEEIAFYVTNAPAVDGRLIETPEMVILRRYHSRLLLDRNTLQIPPGATPSAYPMGEANMLLSTLNSVCEAFSAIFGQDEASESDKFARADWVLNQLWLAPAHLASIAGYSKRAEPRRTERALAERMLLFAALPRFELKHNERRGQYMTWLKERYIASPDRIRAAAGEVIPLIQDMLSREMANEDERRVNRLILQEWYLSLPSDIRDHAELPNAIQKELSVALRPTVTVGSSQFDVARFWRAGARAFTKEDTVLKSLDGLNYSVRISKEGDSPVLVLSGPDEAKPMGIADSIISVLNPDKAMRLEAMVQHLEWFDGFGASGMKALHRLAGIKDAAARAMAVDEARGNSAWHHYIQLGQRCASQRDLTLEQMAPPSSESLLAYLRLRDSPTDTLSRARFEHSAARLVADLGIEEAFFRVSNLPIELPRSLVDAFGCLPRKERGGVLDRIKARIYSPLSRIHYLTLLFTGKVSAKNEISQFIDALLTSEQVNEVSALLQTIMWSWEQLGLQATLSPVRRLLFSWLHGGILFQFLRRISEADQIRQFTRRHRRLSPVEMLAAADGEDDVSLARRLSPITLLVTGLGRVLQNCGKSATQDQERKAVQMCFMSSEQLRIPRIEWLHDPTLRRNRLCSFFGFPQEAVVAPLVGEEAAMELSSQRAFQELEAVVSLLEVDQNLEPQWALAGALLATHPCPPALHERVSRIIQRCDFDSLPDSEQTRFSVLLTIASHAWHTGGEDNARHVQEQIVLAARWLATTPLGAKDPSRENIIFLATEALSRNAPPSRSPRLFSDTIVRCLREWPHLADGMPGALGQLLRLPDEQLEDVWPVILSLRFYATQHTVSRNAGSKDRAA